MDDLDPVVYDAVRLPSVSVENPCDNAHFVLVDERLAQFGEEVRGRLDTGPVVLVEDEQASASRRDHGG